MNILFLFEEIIKKHKALFFDKIKEKTNDGWKIIYNIQGLNYKNTFYPNLKFIFWMNKEMSELSHNVISYLYKQNCLYRSQMIQEENLEEQIDSILEEIKKEKSNDDIINFVINGTDKFNIEAKDNEFDLEIFFDNLAYKPSGNSSCILHTFKFELSANDSLYEFELKHKENSKWDLLFNGKKIETSIEDVYKEVVEIITNTEFIKNI